MKNLLDKARGNLPDIPAAAPKIAKQPASKPSSASASQNSSAKTRTVIGASKVGSVLNQFRSCIRFFCKMNFPSVCKSQGSATVTRKKKEEEVDSTPLLKVNNLKMQRNIDENKLKVISIRRYFELIY